MTNQFHCRVSATEFFFRESCLHPTVARRATCVATVDREGTRVFLTHAHRSDGKRFVVRADEKLAAFMELEAAMRAARRIGLTSCRVFFKLDAVWNGGQGSRKLFLAAAFSPF
jgi:hypothetical protein